MANWDKLNKQFDNLIDNMSANDWKDWATNREKRKAMRRFTMELKAKLQAEKIYLASRYAVSFNKETINSQDLILDNVLGSAINTNCAGDNTPLAA